MERFGGEKNHPERRIKRERTGAKRCKNQALKQKAVCMESKHRGEEQEEMIYKNITGKWPWTKGHQLSACQVARTIKEERPTARQVVVRFQNSWREEGA